MKVDNRVHLSHEITKALKHFYAGETASKSQCEYILINIYYKYE